MHPRLAFLALALLALLAPLAPLAAAATPVYCVRPRPLSADFCISPPVVADFDFERYNGKWYQIYAAGDSVAVSTNRCVTANYTLLEDGTVNVLNCQMPQGETRPQCQRALAERRVGEQPPHMHVQYAPFLPPTPYNIAALLGDAESGYEAAAVYSCSVTDPGLVDGFFVLARSINRPEVVIENLSSHLSCIGYPLREPFVQSYLGDDCKYFDDGDGVVEVNMFEPDEDGMPPEEEEEEATVGETAEPEGDMEE